MHPAGIGGNIWRHFRPGRRRCAVFGSRILHVLRVISDIGPDKECCASPFLFAVVLLAGRSVGRPLADAEYYFHRYVARDCAHREGSLWEFGVPIATAGGLFEISTSVRPISWLYGRRRNDRMLWVAVRLPEGHRMFAYAH